MSRKDKRTGIWHCDFYDESGKRVRTSLRTRNRKLAIRLEEEAKLAATRRRLGVETKRASRETPSDLLNCYLVELQSRCTARHCQERDRVLRAYLAACDARSLGDLTQGSASKFVAAEAARTPLTNNRPQLSTGSLNKTIKAIRAFGNWLVKKGHLDTSPFRHLELLKGDRVHRRRVPTPEEWQAILDAAPDYRAIFYRFLAGTGLRAKEAASITWGDVDLGELPTLRVRASISKVPEDVILPLADHVADLLRTWQAGEIDLGPYRQVGKVAHRSLALSAPVFPVEPRLPAWKNDLEAAGVSYLTPKGYLDRHSLRYKFASDLVRKGASPSVTHRLARHSDFSITQAIYVAADQDAERAALNRLDPVNRTG